MLQKASPALCRASSAMQELNTLTVLALNRRQQISISVGFSVGLYYNLNVVRRVLKVFAANGLDDLLCRRRPQPRKEPPAV